MRDETRGEQAPDWTDWTEEELRAEVLAAPMRHVIGMPDTQVITRPGWFQIVTPSMTRGGLNEVCLAVLEPDEVEATIDRVLAMYAARGLAFRWSVGPDSAPADLGPRLAARGLVRHETLAMACRIRDARPATTADAATQVEDEAGLVAFTEVMAAGWGADPDALLTLHRAMLGHPSGRCHMFVARADGRPVGAAAYIAAGERTAYLLGAVVLPSHRGLGHYHALVRARLEHARARGLTLATSLAMATTSAPILARMGFRAVATLATYTP